MVGILLRSPGLPHEESTMASDVKEKQSKPTNPAQQEPKPPFPKQHQAQPGLESKLRPRPRFQAEDYRAAGKLMAHAARIGLDALVEAHDAGELERAVALGADPIGINARDLATFAIDVPS